MNVVEPEGIGFERTHRGGFGKAVTTIDTDLGHVRMGIHGRQVVAVFEWAKSVRIIAGIVDGLGSSSRRVFPFGFAHQSV